MGSKENSVAEYQKTAGTGLFHAILALDATPHSQLVVENLHRYMKGEHSFYDFLYVLPDGPTDDRKFSAMDEEAQQETARVVNEHFDRYANILGSNGLTHKNRHFVKQADTVEEGILQHIEDSPPDMLVLGMHETKPRRKGWQISSTAYALATHAPCSVVVFKQPVPKQPRVKVLFATDGSLSAHKAMHQLDRFLPASQIDLVLLNVVSVNSYVLPLVEPFVDYSPLERAMQGEATKMLDDSKDKLQKAGFNVVQSYFVLGDPVDQILQESNTQGIDLIVLGSHGHGTRLTNWLLGSVSSKVLEYSDASVAIIR